MACSDDKCNASGIGRVSFGHSFYGAKTCESEREWLPKIIRESQLNFFPYRTLIAH